MIRLLSIALIAALCLAAPSLADDKKPDPKLSAAMKKILDKAVAEVTSNRNQFNAANEKPLGEARTALEVLAKKLVDEKKYEQVKAVTDQIATLEADVLKMAVAPAPAPAPRPAPQKPLLERLDGKWDRINNPAHYRLNKNGIAECVEDNGQKVISQGRMSVMSPDVAEIRWSDGFRDLFYLAGDDVIAVRQWLPDGKRESFALERMK